MTAGLPDAAARLLDARERIAARAVETAVAADPTFLDRYDDLGLRQLLRDAEVYLERIAASVAAKEPDLTARWAEHVATLYRRRGVPMDDLVALGEGLRRAVEAILRPEERTAAHLSIDEANRVFRWHRRLAGDARKRNRILAAIYKGA